MKKLLLLVGLIHLYASTRLGWTEDELYFIDLVRNKWAFGYLDCPPLVPWILGILDHTVGFTTFWVRLVPALTHIAIIFFGVQFARYLGTRNKASLFFIGAALFFAPAYLRTSTAFVLMTLEPLFWLGATFQACQIFENPSKEKNLKSWLGLGAICGLALLNKITFLYWGLSFVVALLLSPHRREFLKRGIWIAGFTALFIFSPYLLWQVQNHYPTLEFLDAVSKSAWVNQISTLQLLLAQVLYLHPLNILFWGAGLVFLLRSDKKWIAWQFIAAMILFTATRAKLYYLPPAFAVLIAASGPLLDKVFALRAPISRMTVKSVLALVALTWLAMLPAGIPLLPLPAFENYMNTVSAGLISQDSAPEAFLMFNTMSDMYRKPMLEELGRAYAALSPAEKQDSEILGYSFREAGEINFFRNDYALPRASGTSAHHFFLGPVNPNAHVLLLVGYPHSEVSRLCDNTQQVGGYPIYKIICPNSTIASLWPRLKNLAPY